MVIFTIGHSTHPIEHFLHLLQSHGVDCVVDVRSIAASRFNPQFNKKALQDSLEKNNIRYMHFDREFGARQSDPSILNDAGQVDFEKIRQSSSFQHGIQRLNEGAQKGYTIALMCAEAEPLDCHRFAMITPALKDSGFEVRHILKDNALTTTEELEEQLLQKFRKKLPADDLYSNRNKKLETAYKLLNIQMGYKPS